MVKQIYALVGILAAYTLLMAAKPGTNISYTEADMERAYPDAVDSYHMRPDPVLSDKRQSYHMDETTYRMLKPFGIVCRIMDNGKRAFDVVVIASDQPDSFHDPLQCFHGQEYAISDPRQIQLNTHARGLVPCTLVAASKSGRTQLALYTYEGPSRCSPENAGMFRDQFLTQLRTVKPHAGTFFRFLTLDPTETEEDLKKFAAEYLDASPVRPDLSHS